MPQEPRRRPNKAARSAKPANGHASFSFGASKTNRDGAELAEIVNIGQVLDWICQAGDAILLSSTSDGGAIVVTILSGDSREKAYAGSQAELQATFDVMADHYKVAADSF
jgi:hypothetical protein